MYIDIDKINPNDDIFISILEQFNIELEHNIIFTFLGKSVQLLTNNRIAQRWAELYLTPFFKSTANVADAVCMSAFIPDNIALSDIIPPDKYPTSIGLHLGKSGQCWSMGNGYFLIQEFQKGGWYILNRKTQKILSIFRPDTPDSLRDPARIVREIMLNSLVSDGYIALHASSFSLDGQAVIFIGNKGSGKTTLLFRMLEYYGADFIGNDKVLARVDNNDRLMIYAIPLSALIGMGTMRTIPSLAPHLHAFEHIESVTCSVEELWGKSGRQDKIEFTPSEVSTVMGCDLIHVAPLRMLVLPKLHLHDTKVKIKTLASEDVVNKVQESLRYPDLNYPNWFEFGHTDKTPWTEAMVRTFNALINTPILELTGSVRSNEILDALLTFLK